MFIDTQEDVIPSELDLDSERELLQSLCIRLKAIIEGNTLWKEALDEAVDELDLLSQPLWSKYNRGMYFCVYFA